jgi:hypothetical protein
MLIFSFNRPNPSIPLVLVAVGRTPASAADPLVGYSDVVKNSPSRARAPGAGQGTRPTNYVR